MSLRVASVQCHEDPSADSLYYLECPAQCRMKIETHNVGLSSLNERDLVDVLSEQYPEFRILNVVIEGSRLRFFRVPTIVLQTLRAKGVARARPYVRRGNEDAKKFTVKTYADNPRVVCPDIIRLDEMGSS